VIDLPSGLHGAFRRDELVRQVGLPNVRVLLKGGQLVRYSRDVLIDRRYLFDLLTRAAAALLFVGPRAVLTSHTSALLHGCGAADSGTVHVLSGYDRKARLRPGLALHQGLIDQDDLLELHGLRVLRLEAAITEMLCTAERGVALACADQAMAPLGGGSRAEFRAEIDDRLSRRADPRGTRRGEALLRLATGRAESPAESRMLLALFDAGLPVPSLQHSILDLAGRERYRLDFAWEEPRVALEYDGHEAHEDRVLDDAARDADLRARGWRVVRARAADLRDPGRVVRALRAEFARRRFAA
jgi:Protein of unknown function (DUF559)